MPSLRNLEVDALSLGDSHGKNPFAVGYCQDSLSSQQTSSLLYICNRTSNITTLRLTGCEDTGLGILPDILLSVKVLERFTLVIYQDWVGDEHNPRIPPAAIAMALDPHADSLVELAIAADDAASFLESSLFGALTRYKSLKRLAIPEHFLAGDNNSKLHENLPSQLEDLQLQYAMGFSGDFNNKLAIRCTRMRNLLVQKDACLPRLKRVISWYQRVDSTSRKPQIPQHGAVIALRELIKDFEVVGVKFDWCASPYFNGTPFAGNEDQVREE